MPSNEYDIAIVGGGILGLATALSWIKRAPHSRLILLEKEARVGVHQTGHNSGVIHSGIYYRPGSLKAHLSVRGATALIAFCQAHGIPFERCGKVIVAREERELAQLKELTQRGSANGVPGVRLIGREELKTLEPYAEGIQALHVPGAGIVDFGRVAQSYSEVVQSCGGTIRANTKLLRFLERPDGVLLETTQGEILTRFVINCAGLFADRLASLSGARFPLQIFPFRGEYYELIPSRRHLVRGLIYPVPDPRFPFLGIHLSRRIDGRVEAGPNAILALKREGYHRRDFSVSDTLRMLTFPGFWRMTARYWRTGLLEMTRSTLKSAFIRAVQRLVPEIRSEDLVPSQTGVRAQALDEAGTLLDDFRLIHKGRFLHVLNAPSPAATASLAIGEHIVEAASKQFGFSS